MFHLSDVDIRSLYGLYSPTSWPSYTYIRQSYHRYQELNWNYVILMKGKTAMQTRMLAQDRRLFERLHALRHLPPNTLLPQISNKEDQQLLDELLQMPDEIDVFSWLQNNQNIAKIALRIAIEQIWTMCRDIQVASSNVSIPDYYQQMFGGLLELLEKDRESLFHQLDDVAKNEGSEQLLHSLLRQLQSWYRRTPTIISTFQGRDEHEQILADLLRLPQDKNPIRWLKRTHEVFTTQLVLSHLLAHFSITHGYITTLPTVRTVKVKKDFHLYPGIDVEVEHITLKSAGFLVQASVNISPRKLSLQSGVAPSSFTWQGFIKAVDNFGYHYLTWVENLSSGGAHFHKYQEQLTMAFYPALAANSTELTFSSEPMVIETSTVSQEGHLLQLPAITGNNLLCYVSL